MPTRDQLQAIVQGETGDTQRVLIGHCPTAAGAPVFIDPNKLFGRHLAVLGNTGAGKSCSVAGLIRWCLDSAGRERTRKEREGQANARFIILDPNGEHAPAFHDLTSVRLFQVRPQLTPNALPLKIPAWLWNGEEWAAFTSASPGVQRPILFEALRRLRAGDESPDPLVTKIRHRVRHYLKQLRITKASGEYQGKSNRENFAALLLSIVKDFDSLQLELLGTDNPVKDALKAISERAAEIEQSARTGTKDGGHWHTDFACDEIDQLLTLLSKAGDLVAVPEYDVAGNEDTPRYFPVEDLPVSVEELASDSSRDLAQFVESLNLRIRTLMRRGGLAQVFHPEDSASIRLEDWLGDYIGKNAAANGQVVVIDLSFVPSEVIHIVVGVLARLIFEGLQRYRRKTGEELPTVLVLEEAHTFAHKDLTAEGAPAAGQVCCRAIERIAREGRKFGLGLVLASQRPSELSPTVLSQCNTFLLHRLVNDRDQELVKRLVPECFAALLGELPSLPSQRAILLGWAAPAPVLVEMRYLPEEQRPRSPDPAFWEVWTGDPERGVRPINWAAIARSWTEGGENDE